MQKGTLHNGHQGEDFYQQKPESIVYPIGVRGLRLVFLPSVPTGFLSWTVNSILLLQDCLFVLVPLMS